MDHCCVSEIVGGNVGGDDEMSGTAAVVELGAEVERESVASVIA